MSELDPLLKRIEALGARGHTVSICYGKCGDLGLRYSVDVLFADGSCLNKPFACNSFAHGVEIAEAEVRIVEELSKGAADDH